MQQKCRKLSGGIFCSIDGCPASSAPMTNSWQASAHQPHLKETHPFTTTNMNKSGDVGIFPIEATEKQVPQHRDSFGVHLAWPCHLSSLVQISHRCLAQRLWQWSHPEPPAKIGFMKISCSQELSVLVSTDVCFFHRYSPRTPKWETTHHLPRSAD